MINLTQDEINYLHCKHGSRHEYFKLELIDKYGIKKDNLDLIGGDITVNANADIVRAGQIQFKDAPIVNYLSDRIKPYFGLKINNSIRWWPLGVFLMVKPQINAGITNTQVYDETIILQQAQVLIPKLFLKGTNYGEVLRYFLISCGIVKINIQSTTLTLPSDIIVDDSKSKLEWFNTIAEQINYTKLSVDSNGWFVSRKYVEPSPLNVGYVYKNNDMSVINGAPERMIDYWKRPNVFKRTLSNPNVGELVSIYKNDDPTNDFSTVRRGFEITDTKVVDNVANQLELDNLTRKAAFNASQVYEEVTFSTLIMPQHEVLDILDLRHDTLKGIFVEQSYRYNLKAGAIMSHDVKRLVSI